MAERVTLFSTTVQTVVQTFADDPLLSLIAVACIGLSFWLVIGRLKQPPALDYTRYSERPPQILEPRPRRELPPASAYRDWENEQDKEKDGVPWR